MTSTANVEAVKVKPCPGCARDDKLAIDGHDCGDIGSGKYAVVCEQCGWRGPVSYRIEDVRSQWNRRALVPASTGSGEATDGREQLAAKVYAEIMRSAHILRADELAYAVGQLVIAAPPTTLPSSGEDGLRETGWLIELKPSVVTVPTWFRLGEEEPWTSDSKLALRFARKADAETYIAEIGWTECIATEHQWG